MDTLMKIGEFLANPLVAGILFTVFVIPVCWGVFRLLKWLKILDRKNEKKHIIKEN